MSWKKTLFAIGVFLIMALALLLDSNITSRKIIESVRERSLTDSVNKSDVSEIYLKNKQGAIKLIRTSTGWQLKEPMDAPADPEIVETLLINVTAAQRKNDIDVKNLAEYGLANPEVELTLVAEHGKNFGDYGTSFSLELGSESTYTGQVFGKYPGENKIFTVGDHVRNSLMRSAVDFRRSRLFDIDTGSLKKYNTLQIAGKSGIVTTLKQSPAGWKITEPFEGVAEQSVIGEFLSKIGMLRAQNYITEKSERPTSMSVALEALTSPSLTVTLIENGAENKPQQLKIAVADGVDSPVYVAQRTGDKEVIVLSSDTVEDLRKPAPYFRSRELFGIKFENVSLFTVQVGMAPPTALIKHNKEWQLVGDPEFRINQNSINERLAEMIGMRINDYVSEASVDSVSYGFDSPRAKFTISDSVNNQTEWVEIGGPVEDGVGISYARRQGDKTIFTVQISPELFLLPSRMADKHFASVPLQDLRKMEIDIDKQTYQLKVESGEWKLMKPSQSAFITADIRKVTGLLELLNSLDYVQDVTNSGNVVIGPNDGPPLQIRTYGEKDSPLSEMNVTKRVNRVTLVTNGRGRTFEVRNQDIDRLYSAAQLLVN